MGIVRTSFSKRALLCSMVVVLAVLLGACSYMSGGENDLLQAPILNRRQAELQAALERTLNLSEIVYVYPDGGDLRSPFVFSDMDGDGRDEAVVFYSQTSTPDEVRAMAFSQGDAGSWDILYDIAGKSQGNQVAFVQFSSLIKRDELCLVVGWRNTRTNIDVLEVYSLYDGAFRQQVLLEYGSYALFDYNGNGISDILVVTPTVQGPSFEIQFLRGVGDHIIAVDSLPLEQDAASILQMLQGHLWDGRAAMYIDELHENGTVTTEVIGIRGDQLQAVASSRSPADSVGLASYRSTPREERTLCVDLLGDGQICVPRTVELPNAVQNDDSSLAPPQVQLTEYRQLTEEGYASVAHAAVNETAGYLVYFPERWLDQVTVVARPEVREWQFYKVDPSSLEPAEELFRVRAYMAGDYQDRFNNYFQLDTRGVFSYYGYIPPTQPGEPLAITEPEAHSLFQLL